LRGRRLVEIQVASLWDLTTFQSTKLPCLLLCQIGFIHTESLQPPAPRIDIAIALPVSNAIAVLVVVTLAFIGAVESTEFEEVQSEIVCTPSNRGGSPSQDK